MTLSAISSRALYRSNFNTLNDYFDFATSYLRFMDDPVNYQAAIVCQNETSYRFYQYKADGGHNITRPINNDLWLPLGQYTADLVNFRGILSDIRAGNAPIVAHKPLVSRFIYTTQQTIGAALDSLGVSKMQNARKLNGDIFEQFMQQLIQEMGYACSSGTILVDVKDAGGASLAKVKYQHDLLIKSGDDLKIIGSVKTSSKDRIDKIFVDKYLYGKLTETNTPHIAIFLNDVQRGKATPATASTRPGFKVASTFLTGRFKAYTIKLSPLDGVYYCDLRPVMKTDPMLNTTIKSIDDLFYKDLAHFMQTAPAVPVEIQEDDSTEDSQDEAVQ